MARGRGGAAVAGVRDDSDFDGLLASYLEGRLGQAGGSLLMPLGALRLLRSEGVLREWFRIVLGRGREGLIGISCLLIRDTLRLVIPGVY